MKEFLKIPSFIGNVQPFGLVPQKLKSIFPFSLTYAFFVAFLIIMSIIVANLLIGLAVDDIKAVQDKAILKRLAMQVELVLDTERLLPNFILRRLNQQREEIKSRKNKMKDDQKKVKIDRDYSDIRVFIDVIFFERGFESGY